MRTFAFGVSLLFIFTLPMENLVFVPGLGWSMSKAIGALMAGFWLLTVVADGQFRKPRPIHLVMLLFALWNGASVFWSWDAPGSIGHFFTYLQLVFLVLVIWDLYVTPAALNAGLQAYVLGAFVSAGITYYNYLHGNESYYQRYSAAGINVNDLAVILALGLPLAWHLASFEYDGITARWLRLVNFAYVPVAVFAIILTASRSAIAAILPALFFICISLSLFRPHVRMLLFAALIGSFVALAPFAPETSVERLSDTKTAVTEGQFGGRLPIWRDGLAVFSEHPFLGVGSKAFKSAADETGHGAHNFAIALLVEVGIIGFALFAIILAMVVYHAMLQPKRSRNVWLTVLMIWLLGAIVHSWQHGKQTWLFFSLVTVSSALYCPRQESEADLQDETDRETIAR